MPRGSPRGPPGSVQLETKQQRHRQTQPEPNPCLSGTRIAVTRVAVTQIAARKSAMLQGAAGPRARRGAALHAGAGATAVAMKAAGRRWRRPSGRRPAPAAEEELEADCAPTVHGRPRSRGGRGGGGLKRAQADHSFSRSPPGHGTGAGPLSRGCGGRGRTPLPRIDCGDRPRGGGEGGGGGGGGGRGGGGTRIGVTTRRAVTVMPQAAAVQDNARNLRVAGGLGGSGDDRALPAAVLVHAISESRTAQLETLRVTDSAAWNRGSAASFPPSGRKSGGIAEDGVPGGNGKFGGGD